MVNIREHMLGRITRTALLLCGLELARLVVLNESNAPWTRIVPFGGVAAVLLAFVHDGIAISEWLIIAVAAFSVTLADGRVLSGLRIGAAIGLIAGALVGCVKSVLFLLAHALPFVLSWSSIDSPHISTSSFLAQILIAVAAFTGVGALSGVIGGMRGRRQNAG